MPAAACIQGEAGLVSSHVTASTRHPRGQEMRLPMVEEAHGEEARLPITAA